MNKIIAASTAILITILTIAQFANAQSQNTTAQYIQLKKYASLIGSASFNNPLLGGPPSDVNGYKPTLIHKLQTIYIV